VEAVPRILELRPHVMVLDVQLQDGSGVQVCRDVRAADPSIKGVLLTSAGDQEALILSILAGAAGALDKLSGTPDIVDAVRRVGTGRALSGQSDTDRKAEDLLRARAESVDPPLAPQQAEILEQVVAGRTDQQIAAERQQPLAVVRDEVAGLIARLTTFSTPLDTQGSEKHRR
jgi:two-component system, NarL family, response regulator DevR